MGAWAPAASFGIPAAIAGLELVSTAIYLLAVLTGRIQPSRTTWLLWVPLAWLTVASSLQAGATATVVKLVASAIGVSAIAAMAIFYGKGGRTAFDLGCLSIALSGLAIWTVTQDAALALGFFLMADAFSALPMLRQTWRQPHTEAAMPWIFGGMASLLNLSLVGGMDWGLSAEGFAVWGFPVYLVAINLSMLALTAGTWRGRRAGPDGRRPL